MNAIELSLFVSRMAAVCDEMGVVLRRTAFSPNIKDRLDFSCALFDARGELCAQAAHIPVHLGSMAFAMAGIVGRFDWRPGDVAILNDPFLGGTHLPDVTVIAPLFDHGPAAGTAAADDSGLNGPKGDSKGEGAHGRLLGFAVNRAHHARIGAERPGSMPLSSRLEEEGVVIAPQLLLREGSLLPEARALLAALGDASGEQGELGGDVAAQVSAARTGVARLDALVTAMGAEPFEAALAELNAYGERLALASLAEIPRGAYRFADLLDDDGLGTTDIRIEAEVRVADDGVTVDFAGTAPQVTGNLNCPLPVTAAAVLYVFRCLMPDHAPACAGLFRPIRLQAEEGSLVNARRPAAVAAGNVETSSRIVDVVLGALAQALPERIPAASQGTMNNVAMGRAEPGRRWDYYETLAGGMGAGPRHAGASAMHSHMTNTLNTPVESLEMHYPLRVRRYALRRGSGGAGLHRGGDGLLREYEFLEPASVTLLTERRRRGPWGAAGGGDGQPGRNSLNGAILGGKASLEVEAGDRLVIETPGGGGWGRG